MPMKVIMPKLSPTMEKTGGRLIKWHKSEGDFVESGDLIAEIETDKAVMEMESPHTGIVGKLLVSEGHAGVKIGELIAIILSKGETLSEDEIIKSSAPAKNTILRTEEEPAIKYDISDNKPIHNQSVDGERRVKASPLAKSVAKQYSVDLSLVKGSGPCGRIVKEDVIRIANSNSNESSRQIENSRVEMMNPMRQVIAQRLLDSKQNIPHFYLMLECCIDRLLELKKEKNSFCEKNNKLTINDFFVKAVAIALQTSPEMNSSLTDDGKLKFYSSVDVCIAVSLDNGLITPVIKNANTKSLSKISEEIKILTKRARAMELKPHEFLYGSITVSTLGMFGIKQFSAIINPPQSGIIAIGQAQITPVFCETTQSFVPKNIVSVTLSADHRIVDGVTAAKFLQSLKTHIENPISLLE